MSHADPADPVVPFTALRILVANGVNLDLLGTRETAIYGSTTLAAIEAALRLEAARLAPLAGVGTIHLEFIQSNDEGNFLTALSGGHDGILINPGAWTHTSLALADRLKALGCPYVEVHLSNLSAREDFRKKSYTAGAAAGVVYGMGAASYSAALWGLLRILTGRTA